MSRSARVRSRFLNDEGLGAVLMLLVIGITSASLLGTVCVSALVAQRAHVQRAADLAALAAAPTLEQPCEVAQQIAARNGVQLLNCAWADGVAHVVVGTRSLLHGLPELRAQAQAESVLPPTSP